MPFRPDRLKGLRDAKGWSQTQLADRAHLSHALIAKTENGKNSPRSDALAQLAQALDCTTDYLLGLGPDYSNPAVAASQMSFDIFIAQQISNDERIENCRRILQHHDAPKTVQAWRSFTEMLEMALLPTSSIPPVAVADEHGRVSKPVAVPRRFHRHS